MTLYIYNTLSRRKEEFQPVQPGQVGMYVCGPTVYKPSHIGHMVGPVIFGTVKKYLTYRGYRVTWVVNITDVDDKLIAAARQQGTTVSELAERMTADYLECLRQLHVTGIDYLPRATEHIPDMIALIQGLIAKGHAYVVNGDVYFDVSTDPDYGKLCHRNPEQMEAGARIEVSDKKTDPHDFALWKAAKPGEPAWESPWGPGRPGWHIECSAMSMKYLGETFDIHGGGLDLQFPHHENELAQSECYSGKPFVKYWMHNGLLQMGAEKMAGSLGNVVNVRDLLREYTPETIRYLLLATHYRSPIEYSPRRLQEARRSLEGFYRFFERFTRITGQSFYDIPAPLSWSAFESGGQPFLTQVAHWRDEFLSAMDDDFNTARALAALHQLLTTLNAFADQHHLEAGGTAADRDLFQRGAGVLKELGQILSLFLTPPPTAPASADDRLLGELIQLLIDLRAEARKNKNFALADHIRQRLGELGILLEDRPGGTSWRRRQEA
jgi:cysteinyl-tRNA synthetase